MRAGDAAPRPSIGAYLSRQRTLRGITLEELEAATRIPRRSLERLEGGAYDRDRDAFARSFVRTVASALGLDAEDAVVRLLAETLPDAQGPAARRIRARRVAGVAIGSILLAVAVALFASGRLELPARELPGGVERPIVHRHDAVRPIAEEARQRRLIAPPEVPAPAGADAGAPAAPPPGETAPAAERAPGLTTP